MKGPSIDAIRRFKEQQEQKKREEDERRIKEKINTLEHRAAQGDRKAKQELRKIENIKEERKNNPESQVKQSNNQSHNRLNGSELGQSRPSRSTAPTKRPQNVETDFEELMRLAKQNTNEIKKPDPPKQTREEVKQKSEAYRDKEPTTSKNDVGPSRVPQPVTNKLRPQAKQPHSEATKQRNDSKPLPSLEQRIQAHKRKESALSLSRNRHVPEFDEDEDNYESDGFVVDDEGDDARDELDRTLKSMFRYDKRKCDLREQELDRQYRAIGRVSTFEDLEREERRASRLAAAEDAAALKAEEDRKRKKKLRLQKS